MSEKTKFTYTGEQCDVHWDGRLCIHYGECGRASGELFIGGRQPWCEPDQSSNDDIRDVLLRCPTGALSATFADGSGIEEDFEENRSIGRTKAIFPENKDYKGNLITPFSSWLALIENSGWGELWFSWRGPVDSTGRFYYRVHGPRILIEYIRQNDNHDHTIVRDPKNDYGEDWLGKHYKEHHPSMEQAMENARRAVHREH